MDVFPLQFHIQEDQQLSIYQLNRLLAKFSQFVVHVILSCSKTGQSVVTMQCSSGSFFLPVICPVCEESMCPPLL